MSNKFFILTRPGGHKMPLDGRTENFLPRTAMKAEMLDAETELKLAYAWRDDRC